MGGPLFERDEACFKCGAVYHMGKLGPGLCDVCMMHRGLLRTPLARLVNGLPGRAQQSLSNAGVTTLADLAFYAHKNRFRADPPPAWNFCHLLMIRGVGRATVRRIREGLQRDCGVMAAIDQRYRDLDQWETMVAKGLINSEQFARLADRPAPS